MNRIQDTHHVPSPTNTEVKNIRDGKMHKVNNKRSGVYLKKDIINHKIKVTSQRILQTHLQLTKSTKQKKTLLQHNVPSNAQKLQK